MSKVIEFPRKKEECLAYLTGETLLIAAEMQGRMIYDLDGNPIREGELYEVTPNGAKRVA